MPHALRYVKAQRRGTIYSPLEPATRRHQLLCYVRQISSQSSIFSPSATLGESVCPDAGPDKVAVTISSRVVVQSAIAGGSTIKQSSCGESIQRGCVAVLSCFRVPSRRIQAHQRSGLRSGVRPWPATTGNASSSDIASVASMNGGRGLCCSSGRSTSLWCPGVIKWRKLRASLVRNPHCDQQAARWCSFAGTRCTAAAATRAKADATARQRRATAVGRPSTRSSEYE